MHVSAEWPLRYRLRAQIYEFLLIRPPLSAVFFAFAPHFRSFASTPLENLRTFSQNRSTFVPNPTAFRRPSPTLRPPCGTQDENRPFAPSLSRAHHAHSAIFRFLPSLLHPPQQPSHAQRIRGEDFTPVFPSPCASSAAPLAHSQRPRSKVVGSGEDWGAR